MAERIQVELVDDIDGSPAQHTVPFALDGVAYEIDLSDGHAKQLRALLARYIERARRAERAARRGRAEEREDRQTRQENKQLTEQIRGAAQRTRERLQQTRAETEAEQEVPETQEALALTDVQPSPAPADEGSPEQERVAAVSLPHFSSAVD
jgi:hypothetical protein